MQHAGLKCTPRGSLELQDAKKIAKNCRLGTTAQVCRAISSQIGHVSTIGKKLVKQQYVLHMSPTICHMVNFSLPAAEIVSLVWDTLANFNGFRVLASLLQRRRLTEASQTLHNVWPLPGLVDYTLSAAVAP